VLKLRLSRRGRKRQYDYRLVVAEHRFAVKGKFIEVLGHYNPAKKPPVFQVDQERIKYWLKVGARPSDSVASLLKTNYQMEGMDSYIEPRNKKRPNKKAAKNATAGGDTSEKKATPAAKPAASAGEKK